MESNLREELVALPEYKGWIQTIQTARWDHIGDNGDQTCIINPNLIKSGDTITIIDQGGNNEIPVLWMGNWKLTPSNCCWMEENNFLKP